jgi:hypothetical protein
MKWFSAEESARSSCSGQIHPKLTSFADEVCATLARLFAYVGVVALFGILGIHAWDQLRTGLAADTPSPRPAGASPTGPIRHRSQPARCGR